MTREDQLKSCKICTNQKFDNKQGIICGLTNSIADFEVSCDSFIEDPKLRIENELRSAKNDILNTTASKGLRFANYLLDMIFFMIFSFIFGAILGIIIALVFPEFFYILDEENKLFDYLLGFISGMIYYSTFEFATGKTLAKFITHTKVVTENGEKPNYQTIVIRSACRFIPFEPFSFLSSTNSGWHDRLSKTSVIKI